ncbi:iron complex outermembrane recepter protein [Acinetobacter pittii]|uniref:TonB-dependent siderophore receptor n=1 Tax=Acinetobacter TaxID=469 RepID=UPI0004528331|nr:MULTISPECIES: TonB-dependent receptor [Acinetobacter]EXE93806.1 tonB-dependent siderophore receptor family protein [Acinetobacter sp. 1578804]EXR39250.1 tonB-dependent siderophore receptor family protein [Acinetobacter sp. 1294243]KCX17388.1 tonB-dependent siderophore receptor family protein [Acinetobacter sp. 1264765]KQE17515.1 TonB-dependent receptor [Acinetobacter pittii]KQE26405.1 TonB-dependent receptor [Acinetobacter pittii]
MDLKLRLLSLTIAQLCCISTTFAETNSSSTTLATIKIKAQQAADQAYKVDSSNSATRSEIALKDTPQSVSVVTQKVIEDIGATRLIEALDLAGGVTRANNFGGQGLTGFNLRGFTSGEFYRNGFPINRGYPNAPDSNTIERVDVLRGPSSSLYGRGDPGGTFNLISKTPKSEQQTTLGAQLNSEGLYRTTVDTTGTIPNAENIGYRLNVIAEGGDSYRDHVESKRYGIAPVIQWQASDATKVTFEADILRNQHPLDRGQTRYAGQKSFISSPDIYLWETGKYNNRLYNDNNMTQLRVEHDLGNDWKLNAGVQYLNGKLHGYAVEANGIQDDGETLNRNYNYRELKWQDTDAQINLTGNFQLLGLAHTLVTGLEYENYDYKSYIIRSDPKSNNYPINIYDPVLGQPLPELKNITTHDRENLKTTAVFAQDQIDLNERLSALLGLRFEHYEHDYKNLLPNTANWNTSHDAFIPRLGLVFKARDDLSIYSNAAKSFKPNTGASRNGEGFDPEEGMAYELGFKWQALDNMLSVDSAIFYAKKENVLTLDPVDSAYKVAAGEVRSQGIELNVAGQITPAWKIIGGYAYTDAEVSKDNTLKKGTTLANIPKNSFNLLNIYEFQDGPLQGLGLGINQKYIDKRAGQTANSTYTMKGYAVTDLVSYYQATPKLRINLDLKNLFDKVYDESAFNLYAYPGESRTVQVGMSYTF